MMAAPLALAMLCYQKSQSERLAVECEASRSDRIRGKYENKIRFFASPEKIFEIFATKNEEGDEQMKMSYADFMHCMTPYNHGELLSTEEIEEYLKENTPKILGYADADNDGTISYTEFIFFLTLYQAP